MPEKSGNLSEQETIEMAEWIKQNIGMALVILWFLTPPELHSQALIQHHERLTYTMTYMGLSSAHSEFVIQGPVSFNGDSCIQFTAIVRTRGISDKLFRIRNRYGTKIDANSGRPLQFEKNIMQSNLEQQIIIKYDHVAGLAKSSQGESWYITPACHNLFSMLNAMRREPAEDSLKFTLDLESELWQINCQAKKSQVVDTKIGARAAQEWYVNFKRLPPVKSRTWKTDLLTNRIGRSGTSLVVWLSADSLRIPLKLKFGSGFSAVRMELEQIKID